MKIRFLKSGILNFIFITILTIVIVVLILTMQVNFTKSSASTSTDKEIITCSYFKTQRDAQKAFNLQPQKLKRLDRDNDGLSCEVLP